MPGHDDALTGATDVRSAAALVDALPDMVLVLDDVGNVVFGNQRCRDVLGWDEDQLGKHALEFVHPDDVAVVASSMGTIQGKLIGSPIELRIRDAAGRWHWVELIGSDRSQDPAIDGFLCVARDITQRRWWEVANGDAAQLEKVLQHGSSIVLILDETGVVTSANNALNRILGHDKSLVIGAPLAELAADGDEVRLRGAITACVTDGLPTTIEVLLRHADGSKAPCPIRLELRNLLDDPALRGIIVNGYDVTELFIVRQRLERLVQYDQLTGVANRGLLVSTADRWMADGVAVAAFFIDLDRFKPINDRLGHRVGDRVLEMVATRLSQSIRPVDLVGRLGGDEFVVVAPRVSSTADASTMAARLDAAFEAPFVIDGEALSVGGSIGFALSTPASTATSLIDQADRSMYEVKHGQ